MRVIGSLHEHTVSSRRVQRLSALLAAALPVVGSVLDVGCGDRQIRKRVAELRPGTVIEGIDILVRPHTAIPVQAFDGDHFPYPDKAVDVVMMVDVLHHTHQPIRVLAEAARVARVAVVVKDHTLTGPFADMTLRFMDWVGNRHHGVVLPYNYWTKEQWDKAFKELDLEVSHWNTHLGLYPLPFVSFLSARSILLEF
jgi:SAM-dependent methyltransferase